MGRSPCGENVGLKKGPWTPEDDQKLLAYIEEHGHGSWRDVPAKAGLQRCGKSCRLRWTNYLRPDIKRGKFSFQEEQTILQLHALLGNRWSMIAAHLPMRTDNEIKNHWNTHLKKRLAKMGIDPMTHKPKSHDANISHMAQWETARLEAEARLVKESKLVSESFRYQPVLDSPGSAQLLNGAEPSPVVPPCVDQLRARQGVWFQPPTISNFSEKMLPIPTVGISSNFTDPLLGNADNGNLSVVRENSDNGMGSYSGDFEDHANYWNIVLGLVDSSPSNSPVLPMTL